MEIVLLIGRVLFGGFFVMGGAMHFMKMKDMVAMTHAKGVPAPGFAVAATGIIIMLAGLGIIFGFYQSLSLLVVAAFVLVITPVMHAFWSDTDPMMKMVNMQMFMKNMALLGAALALFVFSANWPLSLAF